MAFPVSDPGEARTLLKDLKSRFAEARHVVHAFSVGRPNSQVTGCSDDGEPPGTAGRPVAEVLKGSGVGNVLIAVVRWFGGIKLGTGGLVKAYTQAAQALLAKLPCEEVIERLGFRATLDYGAYEGFRRHTEASGGRLVHEVFGAEVVLEGEIPAEARVLLETRLRDLTRGRGTFSAIEPS